MFRTIIIDALKAKYLGDIEVARANIAIYLENASGIGEHSKVLEAVDEQVGFMASALEKLAVIKDQL